MTVQGSQSSARLKIGALSGLMAVSLAGCGSATWSPQTPAVPLDPAKVSLGPVPLVRSSNHIRMPSDAYAESNQDVAILAKAHQLAARDCMRSFGFTSWATETVDFTGFQSQLAPTDYLDPVVAARNGYTPATVGPADASGPESSSSPSQVSRTAWNVLLGTSNSRSAAGSPNSADYDGKQIPAGGCEGEADREVKAGTSQSVPFDPNAIAPEATFAGRKDPRVQNENQLWQTCMAQHGYHYRAPADAQLDRRWANRATTKPATSAEKKAAGTDAGCQQKINYVGVSIAVQRLYQQSYIATNKAKLAESEKIIARWIANSRKIIARG